MIEVRRIIFSIQGWEKNCTSLTPSPHGKFLHEQGLHPTRAAKPCYPIVFLMFSS
jgi:hypothetical protein